MDIAAHIGNPALSKDETTWVYGQSPNSVEGTLTITGLGTQRVEYFK